MKPILQALLLADRVYQDHTTGKKIIAGTFDRLFFTKQPIIEEREIGGDRKKVIQGGMQAGSPYAYISVTEVQGKVHCILRYINLEEDQTLIQCEFDIDCDDPLRSIEVILPLPSLPIQTAGVHALELLCDGEPIGAHRIHVEEMKMTVQIKEEAFAGREIPRSAWQSFSGLTAYVCRATIKQSGSRFLATAIRRPDLSAQGDSPDEAMQALERAYKAAAVARTAIRPFRDIPSDEMRQAASSLVLVNDSEMRSAIAARIPSEDDLALIAQESEPIE